MDKDDESMGDLILGSVKVLGLGQKPSTIKANAKYVDDFKFFATSKVEISRLSNLLLMKNEAKGIAVKDIFVQVLCLEHEEHGSLISDNAKSYD